LNILLRSLYRKRFLLIVLTLLVWRSASAQYPAKCDSIKDCIGNALTIEVTAGKGAQYVDVDTSSVLRSLDVAMTFEAWVKPTPQPGKKQFIGGLWGPNRDNNDQWVLYIQDNSIVFELSQDGSYKGQTDNTIAQAILPDLYTRGWIHIAAVWDGTSTAARILVDGVEMARATNPAYPITRLHPIESKTLPLQIGSCNALYDDSLRHRTFKGQIDEVRLWRKALTQPEINCQRLVALNGNEAGLILYYRCNQDNTTQFLCDGTGNNIVGRMRSGARCDTSDRKIPDTYFVTPAQVTGKLTCTGDTTLTFTINDTSICGDHVALAMVGQDAGQFKLSTTDLALVKGQPVTVTVQVKATRIGTIRAYLAIGNYNKCSSAQYIPITFVRSTELSYSKGSILFDTLLVGCQQTPYAEDTIKICNTTNRSMRISSATLKDTMLSWRSADARQLPLQLAPGDCWSIILRMRQADSSLTVRDTLKIASDDQCPGSGIIPLVGRSQDVFVLLTPDAKKQMTSMSFEPVCPDQISNVRLFQWRGLMADTVKIDTIIWPNGFFGKRNNYPIKLAPKTAYQATYVRFRPDKPGPFSGQIQFISHYRGCEIIRTIDVTGKGISVDVLFDQNIVSFGNVTIGKTGQQTTTVTNHGLDPRNISAYLKVGDVFSIVGGKSFKINPGETLPITLQFRPRQKITYNDTLCIFDEGCYGTICIPITGTGVFEALSFTPEFLALENVIGCQCKTDTVLVKNISGGNLDLQSDLLVDPSGRFKLETRATPGILAPDQTIQYIVTYCPNDILVDHADEAYIQFTFPNNERYQLLLRGTSTVPKIYVTPLTSYGIVEVGWKKLDSVLIENSSTVPVHISSVTVPVGFNIVKTSPALPATIQPRDSLWVYVEFAPTAETGYSGAVTVNSDAPCSIAPTGVLTGTGKLVKLDVPLTFVNYSLIKPCDCQVREIPLANYSNLVPITVDSIWIDEVGVGSPNATVFSWRSSGFGTTLPYVIPPQTIDTLFISYCPNIPAVSANTLTNAALHIKASSPNNDQEFRTVLSGRRELNFTPDRVLVAFPATRVDTSAAPVTVNITVPDFFSNPSGDSVIITGIDFLPDQRVFSVQGPGPFPWVIKRSEKFAFQVNFYPRAPKDYVARMQIHTSFPCNSTDTTILVKGSGFAPAFGLQMAFDTALVGQDTISLTTCDTLVLPVMISRAIPQNIIDMLFRVAYDTTLLEFVDITSPYTGNAKADIQADGAHVVLKDARNVEAGTVAILRFAVRGGVTQFPILLDGIDFDSDSLVFFKIVAGIDKAFLRIDDPQISVSALANFDTVKVRDCLDRIVTVYNPSLVPIRFDSLAKLPKWHRVTATSVPLPATIQPGDSVLVTVTFCPRADELIDTTFEVVSNYPCYRLDTGRIYSYGWAPPFPMSLLLDSNALSLDSVVGAIQDTVEVPIIMDRDVPQTPIDINLDLSYNKRSLQYLSASSTYTAPSIIETPSGMTIGLPKCDSIRKGEIMRLKFIVSVPDTIITRMTLTPLQFTSDSIMWIKPIPSGDSAVVKVDPKCNISYLEFKGGAAQLSVPMPNPASSGRVQIDFQFFEDVSPRLIIYDEKGAEVLRLLDGSQFLKGGAYRAEFNASSLPNGRYIYRLQAGNFVATQKLLIRK